MAEGFPERLARDLDSLAGNADGGSYGEYLFRGVADAIRRASAEPEPVEHWSELPEQWRINEDGDLHSPAGGVIRSRHINAPNFLRAIKAWAAHHGVTDDA